VTYGAKRENYLSPFNFSCILDLKFQAVKISVCLLEADQDFGNVCGYWEDSLLIFEC
jgi:hypothetical protein